MLMMMPKILDVDGGWEMQAGGELEDLKRMGQDQHAISDRGAGRQHPFLSAATCKHLAGAAAARRKSRLT